MNIKRTRENNELLLGYQFNKNFRDNLYKLREQILYKITIFRQAEEKTHDQIKFQHGLSKSKALRNIRSAYTKVWRQSTVSLNIAMKDQINIECFIKKKF